MQDLNDLYYFAKVVQYSGFAATERELGIPRSKLSRRIAGLEKRLNVRLIQRSTRQFTTTKIGQAFYQHCMMMIEEAQAAEDMIKIIQQHPSGNLRMSCPIDLLQALMGDMLTEFMFQHPDITLDLVASNRRIDPIAEGIDLALRVRVPPLEDSNLILRTLAQRNHYLVASPKLFLEKEEPQSVTELCNFPSLSACSANNKYVWEFVEPDGRVISVEHQPRFITDNMISLRTAAVAGMGIIEMPSLMIEKELASGELIKLLPKCNTRPGIVHAVYPSRRGQLPAVRVLLDFLVLKFDALDEKDTVKL